MLVPALALHGLALGWYQGWTDHQQRPSSPRESRVRVAPSLGLSSPCHGGCTSSRVDVRIRVWLGGGTAGSSLVQSRLRSQQAFNVQWLRTRSDLSQGTLMDGYYYLAQGCPRYGPWSRILWPAALPGSCWLACHWQHVLALSHLCARTFCRSPKDGRTRGPSSCVPWGRTEEMPLLHRGGKCQAWTVADSRGVLTRRRAPCGAPA